MKNKEIKEALIKKCYNPDEIVLCPICGEKLKIEDFGISSRIWCDNDAVVETFVRGV